MIGQYKKNHQCQIKGLNDIYMEYFGYKTDGTFVEVGAHDCYSWSNTWNLAEAGWYGVYFEPNPHGYNECYARYKNSIRVRVVKVAISDFEGEADFIVAGSVSTLKDDVADMYTRSREHNVAGIAQKNKITVEVSTLDFQLSKYGTPFDFEVLVVDVEGSEIDVLRGFSIELWRPRLAIIEAHELHQNHELRRNAKEINDYFDAHGYKKIYSDHINNIYAHG